MMNRQLGVSQNVGALKWQKFASGFSKTNSPEKGSLNCKYALLGGRNIGGAQWLAPQASAVSGMRIAQE